MKAKLKQYADVDPTVVDVALHQSWVKPNFFVPVTSVPDDTRYTQTIRPNLYPVNGVQFERTTAVLASSNVLASQIVGTTGAITAERLSQLGPPYRVGDKVGLSGVQAAFEKRLAGTPTASVFVTSNGKVVRTIKQFAGKRAQSVQLTIDPHVQSAAEAALAGVPLPAALVAIDPATGGIRAVVSKPDGGFNRALDGAYPPGSTFKVVTSAALLAAGRSGSTPAPCPPTLTIDGRVFKNFEGEANGALDLARAFAISCNNAFIGLGDQLPPTALTQAAARFGFNSKWSLPVPSAAGTFPNPKDGAERAASAIGQGRILASPAEMASVAAAVAAGQWRAPTLTVEPATNGPKVAPLDPSVVATLRTFMAGVVGPGGTAAGAGLPPGTLGKTGTAEFGNANPPSTHAWFIGYRNNLAFAVIVEGGGVGGQVAAPLAAKFARGAGVTDRGHADREHEAEQQEHVRIPEQELSDLVVELATTRVRHPPNDAAVHEQRQRYDERADHETRACAHLATEPEGGNDEGHHDDPVVDPADRRDEHHRGHRHRLGQPRAIAFDPANECEHHHGGHDRGEHPPALGLRHPAQGPYEHPVDRLVADVRNATGAARVGEVAVEPVLR